MQNFTLGKKGLSMLFFTFILLIGSLPSYGQVCPEPGDFPASQTFCYLQTIEDLDTDGYPVFQTSDTANDTQPIPGSELLTDEAVYYVNSPSGECRSPLTVDVTNAPRPENTITNSVVSGFEFTTCTPATFNSDDLADLFVAQTDYTIVVYASEESTIPLVSTPLNAGDSYFVGQIPNNPGDPNTQPCPSLRVAVGFNPNQIEAPDAEVVQTFCESATVADLEATGTYDDTQAIRWYRSQTANSPLSSDTQLISGQSYFAAQVVNERGSVLPPCETPPLERAEVVVQYEPAYAGEDNTEQICQAELEERLDGGESPRDIFLSLLVDADPADDIEIPTDGTFDPSIDELAADYSANPYQTFETTYTVTNDFGCTDSADLALTVTEGENAGPDVPLEICSSELEGLSDEEVIQRFLNEFSLDPEDYDPAGFDPNELAALIDNFDPQNPVGEYPITYTVGEGACEDSALITLAILESPDAGTNGSITLNEDDAPVDLFDYLGGTPDEGGTWSPGDGNFDPASDSAGTFTYTVSTENCEDSATVTVTVEETTDPTDPTDPNDCDIEPISQTLCSVDVQGNPTAQGVRSYFQNLVTNNSNLPSGGTFDPTPAEVLATFQEAGGIGTFKTTYTVDTDCGEVSVLLTAEVIPSQDANAGEFEPIVLECFATDIIILEDLPLSEAANAGGTFTAAPGVLDENGNFDPSRLEADSYEITYFVDDSATCVNPGTEDSTTFTITVTDGIPGDIEPISQTLCSVDVQENPTAQGVRSYFQNLVTNNSNLPSGGTFDPTPAEVLATFQEAGGIGTFKTTYTVDTDCGEVSVLLTAEVIPSQDANAGEFEPIVLECFATDIIILEDLPLSEAANAGGTFTAAPGVLDENGNFDPSRLEADSYEITYFVDDSATCVNPGTEDSTTFTITVTAEESEAIVEDIQNQTTCMSGSEITLSSLLTPNTTTGGIFTVDGTTATTFDPATMGVGTYQVTYTVNGDELACVTGMDSDSFVITVTDEEIQAVVEDIADFSTCTEASTITLSTLLVGNTTTGGMFTVDGTTATTFDPATMGLGTYKVTYTVNGDDLACVTGMDSDSFLITVTDEVSEAIVEDIADFSTCTEASTMTLSTLLVGNTTTGGMFTVDGTTATTFDPATMGLGTYQVTYTVNGDDLTCVTGMDSDSFLITVTDEVSEAIVEDIADFSTCTEASTITLSTLLVGNTTMGGMFTVDGTTATTFDPATMGLGTYQVTYTANGDDLECVTGTDSDSFVITVTDEVSEVIVEDIADFSTCTEASTITLSTLLVGNTTMGGMFTVDGTTATTFDPATMGLGTYQVTYTANGDDLECVTGTDSDSFVITVTDEVSEVIVEDIADFSTCTEASTITLSTLLVGETTMGGTFTVDGTTATTFAPATMGVGTYEVTYTVNGDELACVTGTASTTFEIEVSTGANAGADNSIEICRDEVPSARRVEEFYLNLLSEGVSREGTFNPSIPELIERFNNESNIGVFETTYTVSNGQCEDSVQLSVTVSEATEANAGEDRDIEICSTEGTVNLFDFLSTNATRNGSFEGYEDGMFDASGAEIGETITITYMISEEEGACASGTDESVFTVTVIEPTDANAGGNIEMTYCIDQDENIELSSLLGEGANTRGEFSAPYVNGIFNPATAGEGEYVITYTVDEDDCAIGTDTATITITVGSSTSEAPVADAEQIFCLGGNSTVADLVATGENLVWYTDATLTTVADETTVLTEGAVYYVSSTDGTPCGTSDPVMVTVSLTDSVSPTLQMDGNEFCRGDNPTVQDLINNLNGSGINIYQSNTGGTALATTAALVNGVTYYATATDPAVGCESTERIAVNVEVSLCGIPEGFSPNGDGINDRFEIAEILEDYPNYAIEVYNRWGNMVFEGNANMPDWDGVSNQSSTLGDDVLPAGVYFYILNYNDGQTTPVQGKLYLSR